MLKSELIKYKAQVLDYQAQDIDVTTLANELYALFPSIKNFSIGRLKSVDPASQEIHYTIVATT